MELYVTAVRFFHETKSIVTIQRKFHFRFNMTIYGVVSAHNKIMTWVSNFETSGCVVNIKHGPAKTETTKKNVARVRFFCAQPCWSARNILEFADFS